MPVASDERAATAPAVIDVTFPFRKPRAAQSLLVRARTDGDAFALLYQEYGERVLRYLLRRALDPELAYDMHAETFALAFERRDQFSGSTAEEEQAWLFAIARSQLTQYWRHGVVERGALVRLQLDRPALDDEAIEHLERMAELDTLRPQLAAALDRLPPDQREAVALRVIDEASYGEIAARQGITQELARARVSRGLRALGRHMSAGRDEIGVPA